MTIFPAMNRANQTFTREQRLIASIKEMTGESLIGDDCAVLPGNMLASSDMLVEGKHFLLPQMSYEDLGWKCMAVNLSDIAAMGGSPDFALVSIALPEKVSELDFNKMYASIADCARIYGCRIVGGDLTGGTLLVISITVLGRTGEASPLLRSSARPGDHLVVSGDFGASAIGLQLILRGEKADPASCRSLKKHLRPEPRMSEARILANLPSPARPALMDASDGLADALLQIAAASKVSIEIDSALLPVHEETDLSAGRLGLDPLELALYGGEDYELVASVVESDWEILSKMGGFFSIGRVLDGEGVFVSASGKEAEKLDGAKTFQHWSSSG